ncbi:MAG: hypothetical protein H6566_18780 [Lewinellaceae bacterium]|nr:hypothetical protein [Lewinellaceae bacterium]
MFDFSGYITTTGQAAQVDLASVWGAYREVLAIDCGVEEFAHGQLRLCALSRAGETVDQAREDGVFVAVYGACYDRLNSSDGIEAGRINAGGIKKRYQLTGFKFLGHIKGSFILFISDSHKQQTFIITDPLSLRSLYYRETPGGLFFSSSLPTLKELLKELAIEPAYDGASIIEYYLFDFTLGHHTMLEGVSELQAGNLLQMGEEGLGLHSYADPQELFPLTEEPLDEKEGGQLLTEVLEKNIALFTDGPKNTAIALTGGYDSRSIAALAGADFQKYQYYSYGAPQSWDVNIPQRLADKNHLDHLIIDLSGEFKRNFSAYALKTIQLGDGIAEASRANYLYVYSNFLKDKKSILSGLFGSELIKNPSSRGLFIDENILSILRSEDPGLAFGRLYGHMLDQDIFEPEFVIRHRDEVQRRVLNNPLVCNQLPFNRKLLYFIMMIGCRKYFAKEIKLERFYLNNRTPFFDIDFIQSLLLTPYPWVYNWTREKSLVKNLKIHRVYASFISRNKGLMNTISTHGFQPGYLLSAWFYPLLALQFIRTKKKITRESQLSFEENIRTFFSQEARSLGAALPFKRERLQLMGQSDFKNYVKLNSLSQWMEKHAIQSPAVIDPSILK